MTSLVIPASRRHTEAVPEAPGPDTAGPQLGTPLRPSDDSLTRNLVHSRRLVAVPALVPMAGALHDAVADFLSDHPGRRDAQRIVKEFFTTALIENRCICCPHEQIILTVDADEHRVRLEISYRLTLTHRPFWKKGEKAAYGRGVEIVNALTDHHWGHDGHFHLGDLRYVDDDQTWWAELGHTPAASLGRLQRPTTNMEAARTMKPSVEKAAEQHQGDLIEQLAQTRYRHRVTSHSLDRRLHLPEGTTRNREFGLCAAPSLAEFVAWSRALGLTMHLTDQYGRVLPAWMPHQPPHETDAAFETRRLMRSLDLRRDAIPCDLPVLAEHLGITAAAWRDWNAGTADPDLLSVTRACVALEVRITLIPLWREYTLTDLRIMQSDSHGALPRDAPRPGSESAPRWPDDTVAAASADQPTVEPADR